MSPALIDDLKQQIAAGQCIAIVGAGVSIHGTNGAPCAAWSGLLHDGVRRCTEVATDLPSGWSQRADADIDSPDLDDLLSGAEKVSRKLGAPQGGEYARWLRDSVGGLRTVRPELLDALGDLGVTIATTNYDDLLEQATGLPAVTWMDGARVERVLRGDEPGVLHLHGHWQRPESVILGIRSYETMLGDEHAQAMLRAMASLRCIVFIGCGDGLQDPNFGALLAWTGSIFAGSEYRRFRLARNGEVSRLQKEHPAGQRLFVLGYGDRFDELAAFLRQLARTDPAPALPQPPAGTAPAALPARPRCFGRDDERAGLVAALLAPQPEPVTVLGPPGIGKTNLALAAAHDADVAARFGARRWFVRCDGLHSRADLSGAIAATLGLRLGTDNEGAALAELGRAPALLIVDNTETPWENETLGVEELLSRLAGVAGLALVVTMRGNQRPAGVAWREPFRPKPLAHGAARELFLSLAGHPFAADPHLDRLLTAVDEVPLAITLLAALAEAEPDLEDLWKRWDGERTAMLERAGGKDRLTNMELSYELSWSGPRLTDAGRRLLQLLAWLPAGLAHDDLDVLLPGEGAKAGAVLRKAGLAFDEAGRLRVLAPLREYVRRRHPAQAGDLGRTAAHFVALAGSLGGRFGSREGADALARLVVEAPNIELMLPQHPDDAASVSAALGWARFVRFTGLASTAPIERAVQTAKTLGDRVGQANCIVELGDIALGRSDQAGANAHYDEALALYRHAGSLLGQANCIQALGNIALARSDHDGARARYDEALPLYRTCDDFLGQANCIQALGNIALARSDHASARARYDEALPLYGEVDDVLGQANCIKRLGDIALARSEHAAAALRYDEAAPLYRQVGDVLGQANCIKGLGDIALARSDHAGARARYDDAQTRFRQVGNILGQAGCLQKLGDVALASADLADARAHYDAALAMCRQAGDVLGEANCILRLGDVAWSGSDHDTACTRYAQALPLYHRSADLLGKGNCHFGSARSRLAQGRPAQALPLLHDALRYYEPLHDPYPIGAAHFLLAQACEPRERAAHRQAARQAWSALEPQALAGWAALDGIDPALLDRPDADDPGLTPRSAPPA